jgi:hypothetical protein
MAHGGPDWDEIADILAWLFTAFLLMALVNALTTVVPTTPPTTPEYVLNSKHR